MKKTNIGGQGVLEGVMMRSKEISALAVRKESGEIVYKKTCLNTKKKNWFLRLPVVRGVIAFVDTIVMGTSTLFDSANMYSEELADNKPSKFEEFIARKTGKDVLSIMMVFAVILAIGLSVFLFFILPTFFAGLFKSLVPSIFLRNLLEGLIRVIILLAYIIGTSFLKDIKRVFMYHGAEHKVINCFEHEEEITVPNVQKYRTLHPRCGTSYLFFIVLVSVLLFSIVDWSDVWYIKFGLRILLLPVVAGLSFELLKFLAKKDNWFSKIIGFPGLMLQKITTKPPEDDMVEVAIVAFKIALGEDQESIDNLVEEYNRAKPVEESTKEEPKEELRELNVLQ